MPKFISFRLLPKLGFSLLEVVLVLVSLLLPAYSAHAARKISLGGFPLVRNTDGTWMAVTLVNQSTKVQTAKLKIYATVKSLVTLATWATGDIQCQEKTVINGISMGEAIYKSCEITKVLNPGDAASMGTEVKFFSPCLIATLSLCPRETPIGSAMAELTIVEDSGYLTGTVTYGTSTGTIYPILGGRAF